MAITAQARFLAFFGALAVSAGPAAAADFPSHAVHIVVPSTPSGGLDVTARLLATRLTDIWHQPVVVDNRPGAGSSIGTNVVATAAPDGTTLLIASNDFVTLPFLYKNLPYNTQTDFAPVSILVRGPNVLVAAKAAPFHSFADFIAMSKQNPGKYSFASAGTGTQGYLAMVLLQRMAGIKLLHVPYAGTGAATAGVLSGESQTLITAVAAEVPAIRAGQLWALAVTTKQRSPALPDTPSIAESGYPAFEQSAWFGIIAPGKTPPAVLAKLNHDIAIAMHDPGVTQKLAGLGFAVDASSAQAMKNEISSGTALWGPLIQQAGIKGE